MNVLQTNSTVYKDLAEYFFTKDPKLANVPALEKAKFIRLCQVNQLDPFKGEVYAIPYKIGGSTTLQIVINYKVYLERAEKSGDLNGWKTEIKMDKDGKRPLTGKIIIHRKGWDHPFEYEVDFLEASNGKHLSEKKNVWKESPKFMLKKTLIKQGFQMAFPLDMEVEDLEVETEDVIDGDTITITDLEKAKEALEKGEKHKAKLEISKDQEQIIMELLHIIPDFALKKPEDYDSAEIYIKKLKKEFAQGIRSGEYKPDEDYIKKVFGDEAKDILDNLPKK